MTAAQDDMDRAWEAVRDAMVPVLERLRGVKEIMMAWERIYYLESLVFSDGFVEQEAGEIVADLGSGLFF